MYFMSDTRKVYCCFREKKIHNDNIVTVVNVYSGQCDVGEGLHGGGGSSQRWRRLP